MGKEIAHELWDRGLERTKTEPCQCESFPARQELAPARSRLWIRNCHVLLSVFGLDTGVSYNVAPGYYVYGEYMFQDIYQGGVNIGTGAVGTSTGNYAKSQGFMIGNVVNF